MKLWRKVSLFVAVTACCGVGSERIARSQAGERSYPAHLPYSFSNLVWWTDADLRTILKKRIPGLGDEIATTTEAEGRIRDALKELLKEKGISAQVMSEEPSISALRRTVPDFLGVDTDDFPPAPKPTVIFMLVRPEVSIGTIQVQANANDAQTAVERELHGDEGRSFTDGSMTFTRYEIEKVVKRLGYFDEQVLIRHGMPYKQAERYLVDEIVVVDTGAKYHIATLSADGGPLIAGRDFSKFFTARPGDPAVPSPFGGLGSEIRAYYQQFGYADVHVIADPVFDRAHARVSYALRVNPGPIYHLRSLSIQKLTAEQEKRVREIFGMKSGDLYRDRSINDLYRAIRDEPLLKGYTFSFSPKPDKAAAVVDLTLEFGKESGNATVSIQ
jgi:outer membrane protein assembly factor BamA